METAIFFALAAICCAMAAVAPMPMPSGTPGKHLLQFPAQGDPHGALMVFKLSEHFRGHVECGSGPGGGTPGYRKRFGADFPSRVEQ